MARHLGLAPGAAVFLYRFPVPARPAAGRPHRVGLTTGKRAAGPGEAAVSASMYSNSSVRTIRHINHVRIGDRTRGIPIAMFGARLTAPRSADD